eukprot:6455276-Amphidinium_carterae.1
MAALGSQIQEHHVLHAWDMNPKSGSTQHLASATRDIICLICLQWYPPCHIAQIVKQLSQWKVT